MGKGHFIKKLLIFLLLIGCGFITYLIYKNMPKKLVMIDMYTAGSSPIITLYDMEYNDVDILYRGVKVLVYNNTFINEDTKYKKISYNEKEYYVLPENLVDNYKDVVKEDIMYVRTPVTIYSDIDTPDILGFSPKGAALNIVGFDNIVKGIPTMYKVKYKDLEGYVYSKYLLNNEEDALKNYDEDTTYLIHKDRKFGYELYGGYASELDYYPYEKANFENNVMPEEVRSLYLTATAVSNVDDYIEIAKESNINAFVVDIYDGYLAYQSEVAKEYSPSAYATSKRSIEDYKKLIDKLKNNNFYVIGRIVAFNNSHFAKDNPEDAISNNGSPTTWVSAFSRNAWEYNVKLAIEAIEEIGFNEIQYDYVRFPEASYTWSKDNSYDFKNKYNESKGQAIQNFLFYATDKIHEAGGYISADVFGESANTYVTAYGQYFPAISNIVDVISAMPYPDHFNKYAYGSKEAVWLHPYELLSKWGSDDFQRQSEIPTPAKARTWIQAYDTIYEPYVTYGPDQVSDQIKALYNAGLKDGYITWNAMSSISKYKSISSAFKKDYR